MHEVWNDKVGVGITYKSHPLMKAETTVIVCLVQLRGLTFLRLKCYKFQLNFNQGTALF